jgi:hypothetical protein
MQFEGSKRLGTNHRKCGVHIIEAHAIIYVTGEIPYLWTARRCYAVLRSTKSIE